MNLSDSPGRPTCPSRASGWPSLTTPWGLPCCVRFPCVHAVATTPAQRLGVPLRSIPPSRVSLPRYGSRIGLRIVLFEACSAFPRVTACTLARSPYIVTAIRRLQPFRYLHDCSGCFRLERLPGGPCTHWKAPPCHGAHPERTSIEPPETHNNERFDTLARATRPRYRRRLMWMPHGCRWLVDQQTRRIMTYRSMLAL